MNKDAAISLGAIRAGLHSIFLLLVFHDHFSAIGRLPITLMRPPGIMEYLGWKFYDRLISPNGMVLLKAMLLASLLMSTLGWWTAMSSKTSALLVLLYVGILNSFGHHGLDEMAALTMLVVLAFVPCGDAFSIDSLAAKPTQRPRVAYRYPVLLIRAILAWSYCTAGLLILELGRRAYFRPNNVPAIFIDWSLGNLNDTTHHFAFWLIPYREYMPYVMAIVVAWLILFPAGVFWTRTRYWYLASGILLHRAGTLAFNKVFAIQIATYLVFVDWPAVGAWLRDKPMVNGVLALWDKFSNVPEFFPGVRFSLPSPSGLLLWDGTCGFCRRMIVVLTAIALRPFAARPFQEVVLPPEVQPWTSRQMHWVRADGSIVGGSQALIEVLEASWHNLIAGALETPLLRPLTWLGYRLIARYRGAAGDLIGASCELPRGKS